MKLRNIIWKAALVLTILPCCMACEDEESIVVPSKYYIGTEVDPSDSYLISLMVNKTDNIVTGEVQSKYSFVVRSTMPALADVQINVTPDESLIAAYNKANGSAYALLPVAAYTLTDKAVIKEGAYASTDSISVALTDLGTLISDGGYLLPLRLSSIEGGKNGVISTNRSVVYIKVNVSVAYPGNLLFKGVEPLSSLTDINRTEFGIECSTPGYDASYSIKYLLDGNYSSSYFCSVSRATPIKIDMQSMHTPKGVSIAAGYGKYSYSNYALKGFRVLVSKDGKKWISYGEVSLNQPPAGASSASNPLVQYVEFKQSIEARYVQITPLSAYGNFVNLSEINLYE